MKTINCLAVLATAAVLLVSCGENSPFVKRSDLEKSQNENAELKDFVQNLQSNFAKQNEDLASILNDLSSISRRTAQLHVKAENPVAEADTIVMINENIDAIKLRIDKLEQEANRARKLDKSLAVATRTIKELRATVAAQEEKIDEMAAAIKSKDATIKIQSSTISVQNEKISSQTETIAAQDAQLKKTMADQVEMIYQAGVALEDIADNGDFKVVGRKDKNAIKEYRKTIYAKAVSYYEAAIAQGHQQAQQSLDNLKNKLAAL